MSLSKNNPFCHVPFVRAFVLPSGIFRNCCATTPLIESKDFNFNNWWTHDKNFQSFRDELTNVNDFPESCLTCRVSEHATGNSFRLSMQHIPIVNNLNYPKEWSIMFGNTCNLACLHCSELFSSRIESDKRQIDILPENFISPNKSFELNWPNLKEKILCSYDHHEIVTLSLLGGEPTYNKIVLDFLFFLYENGYSKRTRLEITTNGTKLKKLDTVLNKTNWHYIYIAVSIDAIEEKAEWLRYGCNWSEVNHNIDHVIKNVNYVELHASVSILNIADLPKLYDYSKEKKVKLIINYLTDPYFLSIKAWDGPTIELNKEEFLSRGLIEYYNMPGSNKVTGACYEAKQYIQTLSKVRKSPIKPDFIISTILS